MSKAVVTIGYAEVVETRPGIFEEVISEKRYPADIKNLSRRYIENTLANPVNRGVNITSTVSIIHTASLLKVLPNIRYVTYLGHKWGVSTIEIVKPRVSIYIGEIYNG